MSSRWDPAPADGGISLATQEDEARERADEQDRSDYMKALRQLVDADAREVMQAIGPTYDCKASVVRRLVSDAIWRGLRDGVRRAESGQAADWILETEATLERKDRLL